MLYYILKRLSDTEKIVSWISKGLSAEKLTTSTNAGNSFSPSIKWYSNSHFCLVFNGSCLKRAQLILLLLENFFFIVYELDT